MATTTVHEVIQRCKTALMETAADGVRWSNSELLTWLNEFYQLACLHMPGEFSSIQAFTCASGTRQDLPPDMTQLLDITRNLDGGMRAMRKTVRGVLDATRPGWHAEGESQNQEVWCFDDQFPRVFFVSPPAVEGSIVEIVGSVVPSGHSLGEYSDEVTTIKCSDKLVPAAVDYILSRCFGKDADFSGNAVRQQNHFNLCMTALGVSHQVKIRTSPNNPANEQ